MFLLHLVGDECPLASIVFISQSTVMRQPLMLFVKRQHIFRERALRLRVKAANMSAHTIRRVSVQAVRVAVRALHVIFEPS